MTDIDQGRRLRRGASVTLLISALALLSACSSEKAESLLLVNAPLGVYASTATTLQVYISVEGKLVANPSLDAKKNAEGKYGFYLPASASGSATVTIFVIDINNCEIASGGGSAAVSAGKTSGPITITFTASSTSCGPDAATSDAAEPVGIDGGVGAETSTPSEAGRPIDGPSNVVDVAQTDAEQPDAPADASASPEVSADGPSSDFPLAVEVGSDGNLVGIDTTPDVGPTPLNVFRNCSEYTHTVTFSSGTIGDWAILKLVFTPDGKNLISFGEDGRGKVWDVTLTGLKPNANGLIFSGDGELTGAITPDGKYLAVGERYGKVTIYDLPGSIASGAALSQWELPIPSPAPRRAYARQFTSDGSHLVVLYSPSSSPNPNTLTVWDLTTQTIVRSANFEYDDWPYAVAPGSYSDPMWVASAMQTATDGGTATRLTLTDIAQSSLTKIQALMSETEGAIAFSPDGRTLAVGKGTGEVGLWDISDKTKLVPPTAPLSSATSGIYTGVYAFGFSSDSNYLAMGLEGASGPAVKMASLKQKQMVQKDAIYSPTAVAFAPDNLALAVGGMNKGWLLYCTP